MQAYSWQCRCSRSEALCSRFPQQHCLQTLQVVFACFLIHVVSKAKLSHKRDCAVTHAATQDKFYKELVKKQSHDFLSYLQQQLEAGREEIKEMRLIVQQIVTDYAATTYSFINLSRSRSRKLTIHNAG